MNLFYSITTTMGQYFFFQYSNTYFKHHIFMHTKQSFNAYNNTQR